MHRNLLLRLLRARAAATVVSGGPPPAENWWNTGGVSSCIAAYQAKGAANYATTKINLVSPGTHNLIEGGAPPWDATNGWKSTWGTYFKTDLIPAIDQSWSAICRFASIDGRASVLLETGKYQVNAYFGFRPFGNGGNASYCNGGQVYVAEDTTSGVMCVAGNCGYMNGVQKTGSIPAYSEAPNAVYILTKNYYGSADGACIGNVQAVAFYNAVLTSEQVQAITGAMQAL